MYKLVVPSLSRSIRNLKESPSVPRDDEDGEVKVPIPSKCPDALFDRVESNKRV